MASIIAFYRPRNVPRNYIVEITLDLLPTETCDVSADRIRPTGYNCGSCGHQHPTHTHTTTTVEKTKKSGRVETYEIGAGKQEPIILGDTITITIRDADVVPVQRLVYTATANGFTCVAQPFSINNHTWQPHEIALQQIKLVDWGSQKPEPEPQNAATASDQEAVLPPVQKAATVSVPALSFAQKCINLQAHLADVEGYLKQYPYVNEATIVNAMTQFSMPDGSIDTAKLVKSLRKTNEKMKRKATETASGEILPVQQARLIIESKAL